MQSVEATGKSLAEATKAAAKQLGVAPESLSVTVLEESKGLFGKTNVRVRAEVGETKSKAEPKEAVAEEAPAAEVAAPAKPKGRAKKEPAAKASAPTAVAEPPAVEEPEAKDEPSDDRSEVVATEADGVAMLALVRGILDSGDLDVDARVGQISGRYVSIELDGHDAAFLVGKHGEVLNALQYLVNIISNQQKGAGVRVTLDGNNYRQAREEALTKLATKIADQVKKRGEEAVLDALPAFERRVVHKALSTYEGVTTYSEGEEPNRRVVIAPAD